MRVLAKVGRVLFTLVAFAGIAALTFLYGLPGLLAGVVFGVALPWALRLRAARRKPKPPPPGPIRWRPRLRLAGLLSGLFAGAGSALLLTQYAGVAFGLPVVIRGLAVGLVSGLVVPSVVWAFAVRSHNRRVALRQAAPALAGTLSALVLTAVVASGFVALLAPAASAQFSGPCRLTINGASISGGAREFPVEPGGTIDYELTGPARASTGSVWLRYGDLRVLLAEWGRRGGGGRGEPGRGGSHSGSLPVDLLAMFGVGEYLMDVDLGMGDGSRCSGTFGFTLEGDPLRTPTGAAGAALLALGGAGLVLSAARDGVELLGGTDEALAAPPTPDGPRVQQVTLSGDEARRVLEQMRGGGQVDIELPQDEQWGLSVSSGDEALREDYLGSHGKVVGLGPVVEGDDGEITISVDVQVGPPPAAAEPIVTEPEPAAPTVAETPVEAPVETPAEEAPPVVGPLPGPPLFDEPAPRFDEPAPRPGIDPARRPPEPQTFGPPGPPLADEPAPRPGTDPARLPEPQTEAPIVEPAPVDAPVAAANLPEETSAWARRTLSGRGLMSDDDVDALAAFLADPKRHEVEVPTTFAGQRVGNAAFGGTLTDPQATNEGVRLGLNTGLATVHIDLGVAYGALRARLSGSNAAATAVTTLAGNHIDAPIQRINASLAASGRAVTAIELTDSGFLRIATRPTR